MRMHTALHKPTNSRNQIDRGVMPMMHVEVPTTFTNILSAAALDCIPMRIERTDGYGMSAATQFSAQKQKVCLLNEPSKILA